MTFTTVTNSTPYAWPFDGVVDPVRTALVIAGCDPATISSLDRDSAAEANLAVLRSSLGALGVLVVLVHHDVARGRIPSLASPQPPPTPVPSVGERVVVAAGHDGFYCSPLEALLRREGRTHLLLAGYGFEVAVHSTLRSANDRGLECLTVVDAVVCVDPSVHRAAVSTIEMSGGIFGAVAVTADVVSCMSSPIHDRGA